MRLTLLTQYYPPEIGAPQARLSELAAHFASNGHSVTVLTAMPNYPKGEIYPGYGGLFRRELQDGVKIVRTAIYPTQRAAILQRMMNYLSFTVCSGIIGTSFLDRCDYLLVESPPLFLGMSGMWLAWLKRARFIFNVSDLWPESAVRLGLLRPQSMAFRLSASLEKLCYERAWLITGQSKSILADINQRFPDRPTFHLSNGVDTRKFGRDRETNEARSVLQSEGKQIALYAGLHGLAQGLSQILEAAASLTELSDLQFVLLGDGPEKQTLIEQAKARHLENVRFLDARPAREIPALLSAADIILVPLKTYIPGAVPSKLYEAMASGRPVVLVADGEAADIVNESGAGMVVKPGDKAGLVEALRRLHADLSLQRTVGENGRRAATQHFDRTKNSHAVYGVPGSAHF